ncbi:MAG: hypothetical protein JXA92_00205 [candidate division Zixibacteria bacterium]|nr:hypothetical protein [candidate division Zixibacteria bacterium]
MNTPYNNSRGDFEITRPHTFHIPVMGTGFTIDTPLKVARYGIDSVISIGDDILIEQMRKYYCENNNLDYSPIPAEAEDARAHRITAYLDLVNKLVEEQFQVLRSAPFEPGSDLTRYFKMLPVSSLKRDYDEMLATTDTHSRFQKQEALRKRLRPGSIDVNIMTKIDHDRFKDGVRLPPEYALAMSSLRGYAGSSLRSSIVLSAGLNRRLFTYMSGFEDFFPDGSGFIKKKIVLKVSDYRSAVIQGKLLAKLGLWVSEYRVESGLNCGGHAFATKGYLMGPILAELSREKEQLVEQLFILYVNALKKSGRIFSAKPPTVRLTAQGGIITAEEDSFLRSHYALDGTGWGTPFLLVPEATNIDEEHLRKLATAQKDDIHLSENSPLGVPFWSLRNSASEELRRLRIQRGKPGSSCPKGFLKSDTEFGENPICPASIAYQNLKVRQINNNNDTPEVKAARIKKVVSKSCICNDLAGGAILKKGISSSAEPAVCCGPGIVNFSQITTLDRMVDHIYGRLSLLNGAERHHVLIKELNLYIEYLRREIEETSQGIIDRTAAYFQEFRKNISDGIDYYRQLAERFTQAQKEKFLCDLEKLNLELESVFTGLTPEISFRTAG